MTFFRTSETGEQKGEDTVRCPQTEDLGCMHTTIWTSLMTPQTKNLKGLTDGLVYFNRRPNFTHKVLVNKAVRIKIHLAVVLIAGTELETTKDTNQIP